MADMMFPNDRSLASEALTGETPAQAPQGNGMLGGMMPMLVQYLSAAGQDIGAGKPLGANVNAATQKNLAAQSQAKMLQKILAGGGKISMDGQKFNISGHPDLLKEGGAMGGGEATGTGAGTKPGSAPAETTNTPQTGTSIMSQILGGNTTPNPTASPLGNITANDLVGLTPENISGALALKQNQDKLSQESVNSQFDNLYKLAQAQSVAGNTRDTAEIKNYQYAVKNGFKGTFEEWKNTTDTATQKDYEYAVKQGYKGTYQEWRLELARASGTNINIGDKVNQAEAMQDVKDKRYFSDPKGGLSKDIEEHMKSMPVMMQTARHKVGTREHNRASATIREDYFKKKLAAAGGEIVSGKVDGKDSVWTVKWRDGKTSEVRYGN